MTKEQKLEELKKWRYAHRGLHRKPEIPENSVAAFRRALDRGFGMELDVHLTSDNRLAVIHDSSLKRVCGKEIRIEEITMAEAKKYVLEESEEKIPELSEVLELVSGKTPLIIELKPVSGNGKELLHEVMKALDGYEGLYCLESFNCFCVNGMRKYYPEVVRGQLAADILKEEREKAPGDPREKVEISRSVNMAVRDLLFNRLTRPDFVAYKFEHRRNRNFRAFKGAKFFWTVTSELDMKIGEGLGANCIFEQFVPDGPKKAEL